MIFINNSIIDTRERVYEQIKYTEYTELHLIKSSQFYFQFILTFIKNEPFTQFEDGGIKQWHVNHINLEKGDSIIQKCQRLFINYIKGTSNLDECINQSGKNIKKMQDEIQKNY